MASTVEPHACATEGARCAAGPHLWLSRAWRPLLLGVALQSLSPLSTGIFVLGLQQPFFGSAAAANEYEVAYVTLAAAVGAVFLIDRIGRRKFLLASSVLLALAAVATTVAAQQGSPFAFCQGGYMLYCAASYAGIILLPQVAICEIFRSSSAAAGVGLCMAAFWLGQTGTARAVDAIRRALPTDKAELPINVASSALQLGLMLLLTALSPETAKRPLDTHLYGWISNTAQPSARIDRTRSSSEREARRRSVSDLLASVGLSGGLSGGLSASGGCDGGSGRQPSTSVASVRDENAPSPAHRREGAPAAEVAG
mmetsp:Transcript_12597/g.32549  ORF Transcript_12597/g.32549 Transcript_12597/m.32549 type:complete len:312 (-) Transcript_12597:37-972(-)